jgi:hypothetical protein
MIFKEIMAVPFGNFTNPWILSCEKIAGIYTSAFYYCSDHWILSFNFRPKLNGYGTAS